jgi:hypothetical protein
MRSSSEELFHYPRELAGPLPDERVVGAIDDDKARIFDAVVKHLRVMERHRHIIRGSDDERRTFDLGQSMPAVKRNCAPPSQHHRFGILVRYEVEDRSGALFIDPLQALRDHEFDEEPHA